MVTLKTIAVNLNLSVMAVSKALRDAPDISVATKQRVRREADRMGYIPNLAARNLRSGGSGMLGVILPALNEPVGCNMLHGLQQEAAERGREVLVGSSNQVPDHELAVVRRMLERHVEALFVYALPGASHRAPILDLATRYKVPLVFLGHYPAGVVHYPLASWVEVDAARAGLLATGHLISLGHKQIIYLSGPPTMSSSAAHFGGYRKALEEAGIDFKEKLVFLSGLDIEAGRQAMMRVLAEEPSFTAVVCGSDAVALGACHVLRQQGLLVPDEISVIGFGDGLLAANHAEGLTTVRHPQVDIGRAAFQVWWKGREQGARMESKVLPVELIVRATTQPPKFVLARRAARKSA